MTSVKSQNYHAIYKIGMWICSLVAALATVLTFVFYLYNYQIYSVIIEPFQYATMVALAVLAVLLALQTSPRIRRHHSINAIILTVALFFGYCILGAAALWIVYFAGSFISP